MNRKELAMRLRWLAQQWRNADEPLKARIETAFANGYARGMRLP